MPNSPTTIVDEMIAAARGVASLLVGDRRAAANFDFSPRGLVGSFIALLVAVAVDAYMPLLAMGGGGDASAPQPTATQTLLLNALVFALQVGVATLFLRWMKRQEVLVPYLVADNWASFYAAVAAVLLKLFGVGDTAGTVFFLLLVLVVEINTARLIMTLTVRQIVIFLLGQTFIVGSAYILIVSLFMPLPPDALPNP